jgi:dTMP kinase
VQPKKSLLLLFLRKEGLPNLFIVFEGGEGAGKTSAMQALGNALTERGCHVLLTREPGGTPEGLQLRALLLASDAPAWDPMAELLLMVAARVQHVRRVIQPALEAGRIVLCDRFLGSTIAYQGAGRGLPIKFILDLHDRAVGLLPDLTLLLDVDPRVGLRRSVRRLNDSRVNEGKFEGLDIEFHDRVRAAFLAQQLATKTIVFDAEQHQSAVAAQLVASVITHLSVEPATAG